MMNKFFKIKKMRKNFNNFLGWVVAYIIPPSFKLGFTKFPRWYESNGYYKYREGKILRLKNRNTVGYGMRPLGKVIGYETDETGSGFYIIEMETDKTGNFLEWIKTGKVKGNPQRETRIEKHFKWNIEHQFTPRKPKISFPTS